MTTKMDKGKMQKQHEKLLKKENFFRNSRKAAVQILILHFLGTIIFSYFFDRQLFDEHGDVVTMSFLILIFWWWETNLRVKHIETIKYFTETELKS